MLLALLRLVAGLGGKLALLWPETLRAMRGAPPGAFKLSWEIALFIVIGLLNVIGGGVGRGGGGAMTPTGGAVVVLVAGVLAARGGGGVADFAGVFSAPDFLFTQRLRSGSYTKLLASPSLALIGLFGISAGSFLPPPNHPPKPQPLFFAAFASAARFAELR